MASNLHRAVLILICTSLLLMGTLILNSLKPQQRKFKLEINSNGEIKNDEAVEINSNGEVKNNKLPHEAISKYVFVSKEKVYVVGDPFASPEKLKEPKDDKFWEMARHYNVDDYGVPLVDRTVLSVEKMEKMTPDERLKIFRERGIKTVLHYNKAYGWTTFNFNGKKPSDQGQIPYIMNRCRRRDCFCTDRKDFIPIDEFDAIVFHGRDLPNVPTKRKPHQRYILWMMESASYLLSFNPRRFKNFFNWTQTYRRDSDFWNPWGMTIQHTKYPKPVDELIEERKSNTTSVQTKQKAVAWFVSNCHAKSKRDDYAKKLSKYVTVDIYGRCGPLKCDRSNGANCWDKVEREYFFYFSAENSRCKDYITEKFYNALKKNVIPIVNGGAYGQNDYYLAPKKSHINIDDFESPEELGKFLKKLMNDKEEYVSYFWWKPYYTSGPNRRNKPGCEVCDRLHNNEPTKIYEDMYDWWVTQAKCRTH